MKSPSKTLSDALESALDLHQKGFIDQARASYLQVLEVNPSDFDARVLITALEGQCKNYDAALKHISLAIAINSSDPQLLHNQGLLFFELDRFAQALESFSQSLKLAPHSPQTLYSRAKTLVELQDLQGAQRDFEATLELDPLFELAWLEMGNLHLKLNHASKATQCFWRGLIIGPSHSQLWCNLGIALSAQLRLKQALKAHETSLHLNTHDAKTHHQMGLVLQSLGQAEDAVLHFAESSALDPNVSSYFYARGLVHLQLSQWSLAIEALNAGLKLNAQHAEAYYNRGLAHQQLKQYDLALESFNKALYWRADFAQAHYSRGIVFYELKFFEQAIEQYDLALQYLPGYPEALTNKGIAQKELKRWATSLENYRRALCINPEFSQAYNNMGNVRLDLQETHLALECFNKALILQPDNVIALTNRANIYHDLKDFDEATRSYELAIMVDDSHVDAHWNLALSQLALGHYDRGWTLYEHRWAMPNFSTSTRRLKEPLWLGQECLQGKTLLLQAEQGLGDSLQFCRFIIDALALGARVKLEVPTPLLGIMKESFPDLECITDQPQDVGHFDFYCPLMSLPKALGVTLASLERSNPEANSPTHQHLHYLKADDQKIHHFGQWLEFQHAQRTREKVKKFLPPLRVGLAWRGNPKHQNDLNRSVALSELRNHLPLNDERFQFIGLQKDVPEHEVALLKDLSPHLIDASAHLSDFTDTAALMQHLDLVICVDTSVAHLSGALARPTWILLAANPDWRWLFDRANTPWYPSARLFRQTRLKDWTQLLRDLKRELLNQVTIPHS